MDREGPDAARREAEVERGRYLARRAVAQEQLAQIKEHEYQADLAKLENKREGEQIQRLNQLYQLEIERGKEKEQEKKAEDQRLYHEYITDQKIIKAIEEQKQREEDDRIKAHFNAKETTAQLIKQKKAEMRRLTQEHQDKVVSQLAVQMNEALKKEDDRLARDIAKQEAEREKNHKEKEAKEKAAIQSIAEYRESVMKMKVEKEREEKEEDEKECNQWMTADRIYLEMEEAKKQKQHDASMEVQKVQILEMAEKQAKRQQEKQADLDCDAHREAAFRKDQAFQQ
ncbi:cilia- and flagella- associated protein 210-like isoform 2-T2 [Porphyrio hochstetteri]